MSNIDNGGPAFPNPPGFQGMTLRDYFAAKAMQAYFTDPHVGFGRDVVADGAMTAYRIADAMLAERLK